MTSLLNQILGPSYSYPKNIKTPNEMGFRKADSVRNLSINVGGLREYVEILVSHPAYGNNFFLQSGKCSTSTATEPACRGEDRYLFVRNIPSGRIPCIGDPGISLDGGVGARGIIPGIMEDVVEMNPLELPKAFLNTSKKFSYDCTRKTRTVGGVGERQTVETRCGPDIPDDACPFSMGGGGEMSDDGGVNISDDSVLLGRIGLSLLVLTFLKIIWNVSRRISR